MTKFMQFSVPAAEIFLLRFLRWNNQNIALEIYPMVNYFVLLAKYLKFLAT